MYNDDMIVCDAHEKFIYILFTTLIVYSATIYTRNTLQMKF